MAHDMEISFFVDKKSKIFCAGGITERQTRKVTETQKNVFFLCPGIGGIPYGDENDQITLTTCRFVFLKNKTYENTVLRFYLVVS